jgi:hypothetical protein
LSAAALEGRGDEAGLDTDVSLGTAARPAAAAQAAGIVLAFAQLTGLWEGILFLLGGAFALIAGGRMLDEDDSTAFLTAFAYVVLIGSLGAVALRWASPDLEVWRGVESVLGAPLVVGPTGASVGCGLAAAAGLGTMAVLLSGRVTGTARVRVFGILEALVLALALVTAFWGPELTPGADVSQTLLELGRWVGLTIVVAGVGWAGGLLLRRASARVPIFVVVAAAVFTVAALSLVAGNS